MHGEDAEDDLILNSTSTNDQHPQNEKNENNDNNKDNDLEDIDLSEYADSNETLANLDNAPMLEIEKPKIGSLEINSLERKREAFVFQLDQLLEGYIIFLEERGKLIECAEKIFLEVEK